MENFFRKCIYLLAIITSISLIGYAMAHLITMPEVSPNGFIPTTVAKSNSGGFFNFGNICILFVLAYAFSLLPVIVMFTIKNYKTNPYGMVLSASLSITSLIIEIVNNLPLLSLSIMGGKIAAVSPDIQLYMHQLEATKFMALDVAGFTLAYIAFGVYALIYFKTNKVLSYTIIGSILTFIANVPFLWIAPKIAVILMAVSILAFAFIPILLVNLKINNKS